MEAKSGSRPQTGHEYAEEWHFRAQMKSAAILKRKMTATGRDPLDCAETAAYHDGSIYCRAEARKVAKRMGWISDGDAEGVAWIRRDGFRRLHGDF